MLTRSRTSSTRLTGISNLAVTAPIKPGFVKGFETITYVDRLGKLLGALNQARVTAREAWMLEAPFPDSVGRFDIIQSFRYAIIPPEGEGPLDPIKLRRPGISRLSLNVTFDAGWEPYMRVIYRDIGTLLDALFCHSPDYPGSRTSPFDQYCTWVRNNELASGLYYGESAITLGDQRYFDRVERLQRAQSAPALADRAIAELAVEPAHKQIQDAIDRARAAPGPSFFAAMRAIKGFYRLSTYFQRNTENDEYGILIRFAQAVLGEFFQLYNEGVYQRIAGLKQLMDTLFREEIAWFTTPQPVPEPVERLRFDKARLQAGIVDAYENITHGSVVLLRVENNRGADAAGFLSKFNVSRPAVPSPDGIARNVAFTYGGLKALGIATNKLDAFPQEFFEGMEKRASLLGDLRWNHPDNWTRPLRNWPPSEVPPIDRVDLTTVHVVVQLRLVDPAYENADLHPRLTSAIDALQANTGLTVLSVQPTRSERLNANTTREHFGFVDGLSQPIPCEYRPVQVRAPDEVPLGELLLGYRNDRDDGPYPGKPDDFFDDGSFLVMRKLEQNVGLLKEKVPDDADLESLMGRKKDGTPPVPAQPESNNFNFVGDPNGLQCPFHSHVRRTNPRDGRRYTPRLFRRGMSYGSRWSGTGDTTTDRGLVFMAFCASIAEQFEVVQRWVAGGNSTGVSSTQSDPFLGVPNLEETRVFRYPRGSGVARVDLGDKPLVTLQWGFYLFAPSLKALAHLPDFLQESPASAPAPKPADLSFATWQNLLEDTSADPDNLDILRNSHAWQYVREQNNSVLATKYGLLVGSDAGVRAVLKDSGACFSVSGYGERMARSIGGGFLGLDPAAGHDEQAEHSPSVNAAVEEYTLEIVFAPARELVDGLLARLKDLAKQEGLTPPRVPVDLVSLCEFVLASLCTKWFGLPDNTLMFPGGRTAYPAVPPRCPGNLLTTSRYIFGPHPNPDVTVQAEQQGDAVLTAFKQLISSNRPLAPLAQKIRDRLQHIESVQNGDPDFLVARTIAGVMLGFPPTVEGNFLRIMASLINTEDLWKVQQFLLENRNAVPDPLKRAQAILFKPLIDTMRKHPLPEMIWRTSVNQAGVGGATPIDDKQCVVLGIGSAVSDPQHFDHYLMFGGERSGPQKTVHACPGFNMAIGVLLALLSGLLEAGELRPTGSSVGLTLIAR